jgi:hypothetical protein
MGNAEKTFGRKTNGKQTTGSMEEKVIVKPF